eukprot:3332257-Ditylum_brightwellii.AAC.1
MLVKMLKLEDKKLMIDMIRLVAKMGDFYLEELLCRRLFKLDPDHLEYKSMLAEAVAELGRYKEAEELFRQYLEVQKTLLGDTHPSTLLTMNNVAKAVQVQGRYKEAEELFCQCLELQKTLLGEDHPSTLLTMSNVANAVQKQGRNKEAEEILRQCLEVQKTVLGE